MYRSLALAIPAVLAVALGGFAAAAVDADEAEAAKLASTPHYNLSLALQESLYFYDAEKSGASRSTGHQPLEWRGDAEVTDAKIPLKPIKDFDGVNLSAKFISANKAVLDPDGDGTVDLSGGYHDAGDHVKFGLPQAYAAGTVGWGLLEFADAFKDAYAWDHGLEIMRWFTDYFLRSLFTDKAGNAVAFNYQVGDGSVDHAYWGPPELQDLKLYPRPAYFASSENPASDQTASHAAALAIMYLLVKDSDPAYAKRCLDAAKALYAFSLKYRGLGYSGGFYGSAFETDEMSWGAVWLYKATGDRKYLNDIVSVDAKGAYTGFLDKLVGNATNTWQNIWVHSWEAKWGGVFAVLDPIVQADKQLTDKVRQDIHYFNKWQVEYWSHVTHDNATDTAYLATTPAGFGYLNGWGSARYNTAGQLEALVYRKYFPDDPKSVKFTDWAMGQMNYVMGDNPLKRSFIVGFGSTTPGVGDQVGGKAEAAHHPHHGASHGSTTNNQDDPAEQRHILWGALVGGPDAKDNHTDIVSDFVLNEVAVDYNAAMVGALGGLWKYYGKDIPKGLKNTKFTPPKEKESVDLYTYGEVMQATKHGSQVTVTVNNFTSRPPHYETKLSSRYFFNISELYKQGQTAADVTPEIIYDAGVANRNQAAKISKPVRWGGENSCVYYVTLDWSGVDVFSAQPLQFGLAEAMTKDYKTYWDPSNDYSYTGLADKKYVTTPDPYVPLYNDGKLIFGKEPATDADESCKVEDPTKPVGKPALKARYAVGDDNKGSQIASKIEIVNTGTAPVDLSAVTVRYWFTADTTETVGFSCDYAPVNCDNVKGTFGAVKPAAKGADRYLELSFGAKAGKLAVNNSTGPIQIRILPPPGSGVVFKLTDDYSYNAKASSLTDSDRIGVYYKGELISGTPPTSAE